jgi:hypothetical protein
MNFVAEIISWGIPLCPLLPDFRGELVAAVLWMYVVISRRAPAPEE